MVLLEAPDPHIWVFWGLKVVSPSYASDTPEYRKFLSFARDICGGQLMTTIKIFPVWIYQNDIVSPNVVSLERDLETISQGVPRITDTTPVSEAIIMTMIYIAPF